MPHKSGTGAILGIASEDGLPSQKRITLIDRSDMRVLNRVVSDEYGAYAFNGLNTDTDDYLIFAVDDDGETKKAAIIFDYIRPIPAHSGSSFFANWEVMALKKEPIVSILAKTSGDSSDVDEFPFGVGVDAALCIGFSKDVNLPTITPAAYHIPTLGLNKSAIGRQAQNNKSLMINAEPRNIAFSAEWVVDLSTVTEDIGAYLAKSALEYKTIVGGYYNSYTLGLIGINYDVATGLLSLLRYDTSRSEVWATASPNTYTLTAASYTVPVNLRQTVVHIAASLVYGSSAELFLNGVSVALTSLAGTSTNIGYSTYHKNIFTVVGSKGVVGGNSPSSSPATYNFALTAFYTDAMSAVEAKNHYDALFVDSLPIVTGYAKEVASDQPDVFFRLAEVNAVDNAVDSLRPQSKAGLGTYFLVSKPELLTKQTGNSIVLGGQATLFSGGYYLSSISSTFLKSRYFLSVEFIAQPTAAGSGKQILLAQRIDASNILFEVGLSSSLTPFISWREDTAALKEYLFSTALSVVNMQHVVITASKKTGFARLFIDGLLVESIALTSKPIATYGRETNISTITSIGIGATLATTYKGYLTEISVYPVALTAERVKAHYDARLVL